MIQQLQKLDKSVYKVLLVFIVGTIIFPVMFLSINFLLTLSKQADSDISYIIISIITYAYYGVLTIQIALQFQKLNIKGIIISVLLPLISFTLFAFIFLTEFYKPVIVWPDYSPNYWFILKEVVVNFYPYLFLALSIGVILSILIRKRQLLKEKKQDKYK